MSSMVEVTRTEYHTFVENMVAAFGEENVRDAGTAYARGFPTLTVSVKDSAAAAMHFDAAGGNGALQFFDTSYVVDSQFLSWRNESDHAEPWKPTRRDTVSPFCVTQEDLKMAPKPRLVPMRLTSSELFYRLLDAAETMLGEKLEEVFSDGDMANSCYIYNGQMIGQMFYSASGDPDERVYLSSPLLVAFLYMPHRVHIAKEEKE